MYNIGIVLPAVSGYSETFLHNKINGLIKNNFTVSIFVGSGNKKNQTYLSNVKIYKQKNIKKPINIILSLISTFILYPLRCMKFIRLEIISGRNYKIVIKNLIINIHIIGKHLDWLHFGFATMAIDRENVAQAMGAKSAVSFRGFDIGLYPHNHPHCYNLLWSKIDKVHTISDDLYENALSLGLNPETSFQKITPAIDTTLFRSNSVGDLHNPLRILTIGRLTWKKGYEYALKALSLLRDQQIQFEYRIVGEGNYREAIIYAIHQLRLSDNVKLEGQLSHEEVKQEMDWSDIYIQPSIQEGYCNAVLEAQAMGLLCIVTNAEGLSENVLDGITGWVLPKRSPEKISNQITDILSMDSDKLNQIRKCAVNRVKNEFNLELQNKSFRNFYN